MNLTTAEEATNDQLISDARELLFCEIFGTSVSRLTHRRYLRWKVAVSTMMLLDREKDSAVNNMRSGRYSGLDRQGRRSLMQIQREAERYFTASSLSDVSPVVDGARSKVCVENSDDGGRRVSQDGIVNHVQKINQLEIKGRDCSAENERQMVSLHHVRIEIIH